MRRNEPQGTCHNVDALPNIAGRPAARPRSTHTMGAHLHKVQKPAEQAEWCKPGLWDEEQGMEGMSESGCRGAPEGLGSGFLYWELAKGGLWETSLSCAFWFGHCLYGVFQEKSYPNKQKTGIPSGLESLAPGTQCRETSARVQECSLYLNPTQMRNNPCIHQQENRYAVVGRFTQGQTAQQRKLMDQSLSINTEACEKPQRWVKKEQAAEEYKPYDIIYSQHRNTEHSTWCFGFHKYALTL